MKMFKSSKQVKNHFKKEYARQSIFFKGSFLLNRDES